MENIGETLMGRVASRTLKRKAHCCRDTYVTTIRTVLRMFHGLTRVRIAEHSRYDAPVTLGGILHADSDEPAVAPDQSFIVFDSGKVKAGLGRLCIAFRDGNQWGKPIDLGDRINEQLPWGAHLDTQFNRLGTGGNMAATEPTNPIRPAQIASSFTLFTPGLTQT